MRSFSAEQPISCSSAFSVDSKALSKSFFYTCNTFTASLTLTNDISLTFNNYISSAFDKIHFLDTYFTFNNHISLIFKNCPPLTFIDQIFLLFWITFLFGKWCSALFRATVFASSCESQRSAGIILSN